MASTARLEMLVGLTDEVSAELGKIGKGLGKVMDAAKLAATAVAATGAAAVTYAVTAAVQFSKVGDEIEKMSKRTGLAAESVSALRVAADASGSSIDTVEAAIKKMQLTMADAGKEGNGLGKIIKEDLGLSMKEFTALKPDEQFAMLGNAIAGAATPAERAQMAFEAFGKAGTELLPMFEGGKFSMEEWSEKAKELGVSFDDLAASKAAQLNDALGYLKTAFLGISMTVGSAVAPAIVDLVEKALPHFEVFAAWLGEIIPLVLQKVIDTMSWLIATAQAAWRILGDSGAIEFIKAALTALWATIQNTLVPAWQRLMDIVNQNRPAFQALAEFLGAVVIVTIMAVIAAVDLAIKILAVWIDWIGTAITAWANFKDNVIGLWNDIKTKAKETWDSIVDTIMGAIAKVTKPIQDLLNLIRSVGTTVASNFKSDMAALGFGGGRAAGGPVSPGTAYVVGEQGPEMFVPRTAGTIIPNGAGGGGVTIVVSGNTFLGDPAEAARAIGNELVRYLKLNARL